MTDDVSRETPEPILKTVRVPLDTLEQWPGNANHGDVEAIIESMLENGVYHPLDVQLGTNLIIMGNHRYMALTELHEKRPDDTRFGPYVDVIFHDVDNDAALRMHLNDNALRDLATWDDRGLAEQLAELNDSDRGLAGSGFNEEYFENLVHDIEAENYDAERNAQYDEGNEATAVKREAGLDLIFSSSGEVNRGIGACAYAMGWHPGIITTSVTVARQYRDRNPKGKPIMFMDNEWNGYDHDAHVAALAEFHPKYATVRDLVTKAQAKEFGVEYYSIADTIRMAEEIAQHTDNVILIPKYDCLDKLPREIGGKRVVLGYSVESSYGGTTIPPERFKGWPVHLLGGSWKKQRSLLNILRDDVVSLDNNNLLNISQFGSLNLPGGTSTTFEELTGTNLATNGMIASAVLSLAFILHDVITNYGVDVDSTVATEAAIASEEAETNER